MALVTLVGHPASGKTHRATQLSALLAPYLPLSPIKTITLISDHTSHIPRSSYSLASSEKTARASLYSALTRALSPTTIVILDAPNYIKGWRYQLHCEARAAGVRSCVLHVGGPSDARERNAKRCGEDDMSVGGAREADPWDQETFDELVARFESPDEMKRWDSPCFAVAWEDSDPPVAAIWKEVVMGKGVRKNAATVLTPASRSDELYELEKGTGMVVTKVLEADGECWVQGLEVRVPLGMTLAKMQRLRRTFVGLQRQQVGMKGGMEKGRVVESFVAWLNDGFDRG